jgi:hypothetical protein
VVFLGKVLEIFSPFRTFIQEMVKGTTCIASECVGAGGGLRMVFCFCFVLARESGGGALDLALFLIGGLLWCLLNGIPRSMLLGMFAECLVCCFLLKIFSSRLGNLVSMSENSSVSQLIIFSASILVIME